MDIKLINHFLAIKPIDRTQEFTSLYVPDTVDGEKCFGEVFLKSDKIKNIDIGSRVGFLSMAPKVVHNGLIFIDEKYVIFKMK